MSQFLHEAIRNLYPNVGVVVDDVAYDKDSNDIVFVDPQKLSQEIDRLEADYNSKQYQRDRLAEYPSIQELVVALYDESDKQAIIEKRNAVKAKYPKPE